MAARSNEFLSAAFRFISCRDSGACSVSAAAFHLYDCGDKYLLAVQDVSVVALILLVNVLAEVSCPGWVVSDCAARSFGPEDIRKPLRNEAEVYPSEDVLLPKRPDRFQDRLLSSLTERK